MGRSRVVRPESKQINLVDVHRQALSELTRDGLTPEAYDKELARRLARVKQAEEDWDWIIVKKRLNAGESRAQFARIVKDAPGGERPTLDSIGVGLSRILAYLLDWSLVDDKGIVLPLRTDKGDLSVDVMTSSLNSIDPESFGEILKAIEAHEEAMDKEREQEKNGKGGASESLVISPSPESSTGDMSGSLNSTLMSTTS